MAYGHALAALADPTRRKIFERLRRGPSPVGVLADGLPVSRPAVSQHLKVLKEAGLVSESKTARVASIASIRTALASCASGSTSSGTWRSGISRQKPRRRTEGNDENDRHRAGEKERRGRGGPGARLRRVHRRDRPLVAEGAPHRLNARREGNHRGKEGRAVGDAARERIGNRERPHAGLGSAEAHCVFLGDQRPVEARDEPRHRLRGRGSFHRRRRLRGPGSSWSTASSSA